MSTGLIAAILRDEGTSPVDMMLFIMYLMMGMMAERQDFKSGVGIGSRELLEEFIPRIILDSSASVSSEKQFRVWPL